MEFIRRCFDVMNEADHHVYQILTKRPERVYELAERLLWKKHIWLGTSVENSAYLDRIHMLQRIPAQVKFLSIEPLLGRIPDLPLKSIDWVIVGGESGPNARRMEPEWVRIVRDQCIRRGVPFFFKQWGAFGADGVRRSKKLNGREIDGRTWNQFPQHALGTGKHRLNQLTTIGD
jgi:protein gp37